MYIVAWFVSICLKINNKFFLYLKLKSVKIDKATSLFIQYVASGTPFQKYLVHLTHFTPVHPILANHFVSATSLLINNGAYKHRINPSNQSPTPNWKQIGGIRNLLNENKYPFDVKPIEKKKEWKHHSNRIKWILTFAAV